jgi:agmatine/peptidylarginine deiminase
MRKLNTKLLAILALLAIGLNISALAQTALKKDKPTTLKHWMDEEEAKLKHLIGQDAYRTDPPPGPVTNIAEFEKQQSVLIRYQFGITYELIAALSQESVVVTLVGSTSDQTYVTNQYANQGVNLDNCEFIIAPTNSVWTRDYGPWFIFDGNDEMGIVDFTYNRPRPLDNAVPAKVADDLGINLFAMDIATAGGNYMTDGMGISASSDLIYEENQNYTPAEVDQIFEDYLGIHTYHAVPDPNNTYIDHIDCWGKYLSWDKILIRSVPQSHPQYDEIEATADYFASQTSSFGTPYRVFRVYTPNDQPYTNSLIVNDRVFVPIVNSSYDAEALAVYEEAMPGYEVMGFTGTWQSTDALHCRTKGIADINQVHIRHIPLVGEQPVQSNYEITATVKAFSGAALLNEAPVLNYRINGAAWQMMPMTNTSGTDYSAVLSGMEQGSQVDYYIYAEDELGNFNNHPFVGAPDPYSFFAGDEAFAQIGVTPGEISLEAPVGQTATDIIQICNTGQIDLNFTIETQTAVFSNLSFTLPDSPAASSYDYNTWTDSNWTEFSIDESGEVAGVEVSFEWQTDSWPEEGSLHIMAPDGTESSISIGNPAGNYTIDMTTLNGSEMNGTWRLWIEDTYGDGGHQATDVEVKVTFVESNTEWLSASPASGTVAPGDCLNVLATCDATELAIGQYNGLISIASNDPDFPVTEIPVTFNVTEMGVLSMLPDTLFFLDNTSVNEGLTATLANFSGADVLVQEVQTEFFGEIPWVVQNFSQSIPHTLAPGEELTFVVIPPQIVKGSAVELYYDSLHIATDAGEYYLQLVLDLDLIVGIDEIKSDDLNVYPNPFSNRLSIDLSGVEEPIEKMSIIDMNGKVVKTFENIPAATTGLVWQPGTEIKQGIYFVHIANHDKMIKLIKVD